MIIKYKFKKTVNFLIIITVSIIFFNTLLLKNLHASSFKIDEIEVSEDFNLDFNKEKVFDKAFELAFLQLISKVIVSNDIKKVEKTSLSKIKSLIDSFNVSDEKFLENKYHAKFNVNFNKRNVYNYLESKNIFPSIPKKINLLLLPILINIEKNKISYFNENPIYKNWKNNQKNYYLLNYIVPSEDIEDLKIIDNNIYEIDKFKFESIIKKYDLDNYIILIIYQNKKNVNILSKLHLNNQYKILNFNYNDVDLQKNESINQLIFQLKKIYENEWKKLNIINTSIKLPLTISLSSNEYGKIQLFEKTLKDLDLVSSFIVSSFNNEYIFYKVVYNGPPDKFFNEINSLGLTIERKNQIWNIQ